MTPSQQLIASKARPLQTVSSPRIIGHPYARLLSPNTAVTKFGQIFGVRRVMTNAKNGAIMWAYAPTN